MEKNVKIFSRIRKIDMSRSTRSINLRGRTQAPAAAPAATRSRSRSRERAAAAAAAPAAPAATRAAATRAAATRARSRSRERVAGGGALPEFQANGNWFFNAPHGRAAKMYQTTLAGQVKLGADGKPLPTSTFWDAWQSGSLKGGFTRYATQADVGAGQEASAARESRAAAPGQKKQRVKARPAFYRLSGGSRRALFVGKFQPGAGDLGPFVGRGGNVEEQEADAKNQARDAAIRGSHLKGTLSTGSTRKPIQHKASDRYVFIASTNKAGINSEKRIKVGGAVWNKMIADGGEAARRDMDKMAKYTYDEANKASQKRSDARRESKATMTPEERKAANSARIAAVRGRVYDFCVYKTAPGAPRTGRGIGVWPNPTNNSRALATSMGLPAGASGEQVRDFLLKAVRDGRLGVPPPGTKCTQSLLQ